MRTHRVIIEPTSIRGERGQRYRVLFEGEVLIEDTWDPEFEACRALVARGVTGRLEVWRVDKPYPGLIFPVIASGKSPFGDLANGIEEGARWTVVENDKEGPVIKRWDPFPEHLQPDAVPRGRVLAPAAEINRCRVTHPRARSQKRALSPGEAGSPTS